MLMLILSLAAEPQAVVPPPIFRPPVPDARLINPASDRCQDQAVRTRGPVTAGALGLSRSDDVSHYLLLDRWVDGCPAPIVVNQRVPGSNAVIRQPGVTPDAIRPPEPQP